MRGNESKLLIVCILITILITPLSSVVSGINISESSSSGDLADQVNIKAFGASFFDVLVRGWVFRIESSNENNVEINFKMIVNVTKKDGTVLFTPLPVIPPFPLKSYYTASGQFQIFRDFREKNYLFGFFDINVHFIVLDDNSSRKEVFHGMIFGISAIIFNNDGDVVD